VLKGAPRDRDFARVAFTAIDQDIGRIRGLRSHVALDVAGADVQIPHCASASYDSATTVIANVTADHVDLVQIDVVEEDAAAGVGINVAGGNQHVPVQSDQMNSVPDLVDDAIGDGELHRAFGLDGIRLGVLGREFDPSNVRAPLLEPNARLERAWSRGPGVSTDQADRRSGARHDDSRSALTAE